MCTTNDAASPAPAAAAAAAFHDTPEAGAGSRRRRLWELGSHAHCPVVGVCLPIDTLRRLADKLFGGQVQAADYELHCGAIAECKRRSPLAEALQRELDRRAAGALRLAARAKTTAMLADWWRLAADTADLGGALWATLTHARCTAELEQLVLAEVHMRQHQVGVARRVDVQRIAAMAAENAVFARELSTLRERTARQAEDHARRLDTLQAELVQARAQLIGRDTALAALAAERDELAASLPQLKERLALQRVNESLVERNRSLQRALQQAQAEAERLRQRAEAAPAATAAPQPEPAPEPVRLDHRAVLCVGGRPASVPFYRHLVERRGGRFLHHDGGEEQTPARLDATLAAADLVICQTGCISHEAYWRVKDHCKRTGKRCVFVETPSRAGLERALLALAPADACASEAATAGAEAAE